MNECVRIELDVECGRHSELEAWARRLNTTTEELVQRAISAWLSEMGEDGDPLDIDADSPEKD